MKTLLIALSILSVLLLLMFIPVFSHKGKSGTIKISAYEKILVKFGNLIID